MQSVLHSYANLDIRAGSVFDLVFNHTNLTGNQWGEISGVKLGIETSQTSNIGS